MDKRHVITSESIAIARNAFLSATEKANQSAVLANEAREKLQTQDQQVQDAIAEALTQTDINPDFISYEVGTLPDSTGATEGTIGAFFTDDNVLQKLEWDGSEWQEIGEAVSTKKYVDDKASLLSDQIEALADGTGKTYTSLADAMAVDPLPPDNTPFRVNGDTELDGNYIYDSSEEDDYKFLSPLVNNSDIQKLLNSIVTVGEPW